MFDKNADETMSWIGEKEAEMSTEELGQDLESIQSLLERQQGFHRDLDAIKVGYSSSHRDLDAIKVGYIASHRDLDAIKVGYSSSHRDLDATKV